MLLIAVHSVSRFIGLKSNSMIEAAKIILQHAFEDQLAGLGLLFGFEIQPAASAPIHYGPTMGAMQGDGLARN